MATLPRAGAPHPADRRDGHLLRPGQYLLVGPIPATLTVRVRLHRPMHDPLASHLSLLTGGTQLGPSPPAWSAPAASAETSSGASANGAPDRTCHLRLGHLQPVVFVGAGAVDHAPAERRADRPRVGAMAIRGDLIRDYTSDGLRRAEEGLGRGHVAVLAQQGVHEVAVAVDGP